MWQLLSGTRRARADRLMVKGIIAQRWLTSTPVHLSIGLTQASETLENPHGLRSMSFDYLMGKIFTLLYGLTELGGSGRTVPRAARASRVVGLPEVAIYEIVTYSIKVIKMGVG